MPSSIPLDERLPRRWKPNPNDIFVLVKRDIADDALIQPALLVWPGDEIDRVRSFWRDAVSHKGNQTDLDEVRAADLLEFCGALGSFPQYGRAIEYIRKLAGDLPKERIDAPALDFISVGGQAPRNDIVRVLPQREARPDPHRMKVRFHRPT